MRTIDPRHPDYDLILHALSASEYEFATLIPRLTQPYRKNAEAVRELLQAAMRRRELEMNSRG